MSRMRKTQNIKSVTSGISDFLNFLPYALLFFPRILESDVFCYSSENLNCVKCLTVMIDS